jgi:hypothetical protein
MPGSDEPQNWRIDVPQGHVDLYLELINEPRALSANEARIMIELVDAWRDLEHRKHIALKSGESGSRSEAS